MLAKLVAATPDPFIQTIVDVVVPKTVFGRMCLLGDAAFLVRPHTAGATAKAARDATVLATALKRARRNVDAGLASFEDMQLEYGRDLTNYGVALGNRWAAKIRSPLRANTSATGESLGWVSQPRLREYDLSIYGAGPAGLSAAVHIPLAGCTIISTCWYSATSACISRSAQVAEAVLIEQLLEYEGRPHLPDPSHHQSCANTS